jgi:hypothetical protein
VNQAANQIRSHRSKQNPPSEEALNEWIGCCQHPKQRNLEPQISNIFPQNM